MEKRAAIDDEETLTAYHEAGHAVIGYVLGGNIDRIQLGGEPDENIARQFGDCLVSWNRTVLGDNWQVQRELLTILAGPVAEMIYRGEKLHPAAFPPWKHDWQQSFVRCEAIVSDVKKRTAFLEQLIHQLHTSMAADSCWPAIAAVADELLAHEYLEQEQLDDALQFWIG